MTGLSEADGPLAERATTGAIWLTAQTWFAKVGGFVTVVILARLLTPTDFGLVAVAILGLLARAVMSGSYSGALFLVFLIGVFVWQIGGFMRRNRPVKYTPDDLPPHLLP